MINAVRGMFTKDEEPSCNRVSTINPEYHVDGFGFDLNTGEKSPMPVDYYLVEANAGKVLDGNSLAQSLYSQSLGMNVVDQYSDIASECDGKSAVLVAKQGNGLYFKGLDNYEVDMIYDGDKRLFKESFHNNPHAFVDNKFDLNSAFTERASFEFPSLGDLKNRASEMNKPKDVSYVAASSGTGGFEASNDFGDFGN